LAENIETSNVSPDFGHENRETSNVSPDFADFPRIYDLLPGFTGFSPDLRIWQKT
jgi:hypothetical protein